MQTLRGTRRLGLPWLVLAAAMALTACSGGGGGGSSSSSSSSGGSSSSSGAVALCPNLPQADALIGQNGYAGAQANAGGVSASTLAGPQGSAASAGNTLYLADTGNHRVLGYSPLPGGVDAAATLVLGQPDAVTTTPGTAPAGGTAIKFNQPAAVSTGTSGSSTYLVVADSGNNRVLIWNQPPTSKDTAPDVVVGQPDFTHNDVNYVATGASVPAAYNLNNPTSAIIANGKLIVVDHGNNRVLIWKAVPTAALAPADFVLGQQGMDTNGEGGDVYNNATGTYTMEMRQPTDAWSAGAQLLITDTNNQRVLVYNNIPNTTNPQADNVIGQSAIGSIVLAPSVGKSGLNTPLGVTSDGNNIFVADSGNNRILEYVSAFGRNQPPANYVFGQQDFTHYAANDPDQNNLVGDQRNNPATAGVSAGTLFNPRGVLVNGHDLYVTDAGNNRALHFAVSSGVDGTMPQTPCTH